MRMQQAQRRIEQGYFHALPAATARPLLQRKQDPERRVLAGHDVDDRDTHAGGCTVGITVQGIGISTA
jgi:hypothetical protein